MAAETEIEEFEFHRRAEQEQAARREAPGMGEVIGGAVTRAVPNLLNLPVTVANAVARGLTPPPLREKVPQIPNLPMKAAESIGMVDPNKAPRTPVQRIVDTAIQSGVQSGLVTGPGGVIPGMVAGAAGQAV